jgi:nucleotide-binding universal stress UspA family protein
MASWKEESEMALKMVVGIDSSEYARYALKRAIEMAQKADGSLVVVCGRKPKTLSYVAAFQPAGTVATAMKEADEAASRALQQAADEAAAAGIDVKTESVYEDPAESLINVAGRELADLIVIGVKGEGSLSDRLFGSTVTDLLKNSETPILLVPTK